MTYSTGSIIDDGDYNTFVSGSISGAANHNVENVNTLWGAGTGDRGYGQSGTLSSVAAGTIITATQWANLFNRVDTIAAHQGTAITPITSPTVGDEIEAFNTFTTNLSDVWGKRLNCAASGGNVATGGSTNRTTSWVTSVTFQKTITFGSAEERQTFFNAGGHVTLAFSRTGGSATSKNAEWTDLLDKTGSLRLTGATPGVNSGIATIAGTPYTGFNKIGGGGTPNTLATAIGFHQLTASHQTLFQQYADTPPYVSNWIRVRAQLISNGIRFEVVMTDASTDDNPADTINGTLNATISFTPPSTANISNSWGTPTLGGSQSGS